jgi:hypothetical protein
METPFIVFIRHGLTNHMNSLGYKDLCTIQCVSQEAYNIVQDYMNLNEKQLLYNELSNYTTYHAQINTNNLLNIKTLIKYLACIRQYYKKDVKKMVYYIEPLTISSLSMFFTNLKGTLNEQICTIMVLMNCHQHNNIGQNALVIILIYYFIIQILNNHKNEFNNENNCLLAHKPFVSVVKNKIWHLQNELRSQFLEFPTCFVERIKRILSEAETKLSNHYGH